MNNTAQNLLPSCVIIPSTTGSTTNCVQMPMPSVTSVTLILLINWIILMMVAYIIYYFLKNKETSIKYNYWIILIILFVACMFAGWITRLI